MMISKKNSLDFDDKHKFHFHQSLRKHRDK
jgi:hypothetical protein